MEECGQFLATATFVSGGKVHTTHCLVAGLLSVRYGLCGATVPTELSGLVFFWFVIKAGLKCELKAVTQNVTTLH